MDYWRSPGSVRRHQDRIARSGLTHFTESEMQDTDSSWCSFREIEAAVMTWNAGASTPASLRYEEQEPNMLRMMLQLGRAPDLLVFGFQELVDLEDKRLTASLWLNP